MRHCPGTLGGADWNGAAYCSQSKALYVNSVDWCSTTQVFDDHYVEASIYLDGLRAVDPASQAKGFTRAFDAASGKEPWVRRFDCPMLAGVTPTAGGIVFTGAVNGNFMVLSARDGSTIYRFNTGGAIAAEPTTYLVDGKQYVAVASGNSSRLIWQTGGAMTVVVFALRD